MKYGVIGENKAGEKFYFLSTNEEGAAVIGTNFDEMYIFNSEKGAFFRAGKLNQEFEDIKFSPYPAD